MMMNPNFSQQVAADRREALMAAAERHRLLAAPTKHRVRRWWKLRTVRPGIGPGPFGGRILPFPASTTDVSAASTNISPAPSTATSDLEHASARVA